MDRQYRPGRGPHPLESAPHPLHPDSPQDAESQSDAAFSSAIDMDGEENTAVGRDYFHEVHYHYHFHGNEPSEQDADQSPPLPMARVCHACNQLTWRRVHICQHCGHDRHANLRLAAYVICTVAAAVFAMKLL